ncbi:ROK family protein [Pedobacter sp. KR3-3]|uniref:ROK family protein n=1 Tax=Pedobacter albus TaxID=3113905 RepID=A0ABU7I605_9SPHI|nr:ROK family protein [Pedobacter sp. KR3-3]MEE1944873.1 ROK family protein [Pedobacter sp. KR3-3]
MDKYVMGIDIGGSHITTAMLNMENKTILADSYVRKKINSRAGHEQILNDWTAVIGETLAQAGMQSSKIGIAMPGPFDYETGISYMKNTTKYESFYGLNVKEMLAAQLGMPASDILMQNDAACFLAGETFAGAGQGFDKVIGLTLGTGLGTAVYEKGKVSDADLWRTPFLDSYAEDHLSTRWFLRHYYELTGINVIDVKEMAKFYETSPNVREVFEEFAVNLANFIMDFQQKENAEALIIGGNIANASGKFLPGLAKQFKKHDFVLPIYISELNEQAALIGAASCWQGKN